MTEPTPAQLDALLDRAERHALSHTEATLLADTVHRLVDRVAEYEAAIGWETTCLRCARDTTAAYAETCRAEQAEAAVQRVRDLHRPFVDRRRGLLALEYARPGATTPPACAECLDELLPCPTIRALDNQEPQ
jgi:hypothetical protein